jgi:F420H(2)-dependent quinone reductase
MPNADRTKAQVLRRAGAIAALGAMGYALYLCSDAHRHGNRLLYQDGRPNPLGRAVGRLWSLVDGWGIGPSFFVSLETVGHRTGRTRAIPVVLADYRGEHYIVSTLGERSPWVQNVRPNWGPRRRPARPASGGATRRGGACGARPGAQGVPGPRDRGTAPHPRRPGRPARGVRALRAGLPRVPRRSGQRVSPPSAARRWFFRLGSP